MTINLTAAEISRTENFYYLGETVSYNWEVFRNNTDGFEHPAFDHLTTLAGENGIVRASNIDTESAQLIDFVTVFSEQTIARSGSVSTVDLEAGLHRLQFTADPFLNVAESSDLDNIATSALFPIYDAVVFGLTNTVETDTSSAVGEIWQFSFGLQNFLDYLGQDVSEYTLRLVLSEDSSFDDTDYLLDDITLGSNNFTKFNDTYATALAYDVPQDLDPGTYKLGLIFDPNDDYFEQTESVAIELMDLELVAPEPVYDFSISRVTIERSEFEDGETVEASFEINNNSEFDFAGSLDISQHLLRFGGEFNVGDAKIDFQTTPLLANSTQVIEDYSFVVSQGPGQLAFPAGPYDLRLTVDAPNIFAESDETNNSATTELVVVPQGSNDPAPASTSDFDGNGHDDILFFNETTRKVGQFEMPSGDWSAIGGAGVGWEAVGFGRFDDDDTSADILWFNESTGGVGRFDMDGGTIDRWDGIGFAGAGWDAVGSGDFNGDGVDDILWVNESTGRVGQFRMIDTQPQWVGIGSTGSGWEVAGIADFNDDGIDDILWENASTGGMGQFRMSANGKEWKALPTLGAGYSVVGTADFNGGDAEDILVYNESTRKVGFFDLYEDLNGEAADWYSLGTAGAGWSVQGTGDFNGDEVDDILWRHDDGRMGQYQMKAFSTDFEWQAMSAAGSDWDVIL